MCGRFTLRTPTDQLAAHFQAELFQVGPRYNIAPTQRVLALRTGPEGTRDWFEPRWGLIPSWAADPSFGARTINARVESAAEKPTFRSAFRRRRCLIPADGFFEWTGSGKVRQPLLFELEGKEPFAFAGLWERWDRGDVPIESCTILTTAANDRMRSFHDRMPILVEPKDYAPWLDISIQDPRELSKLLVDRLADHLKSTPVQRVVNSPRNDTPECVEPI